MITLYNNIKNEKNEKLINKMIQRRQKRLGFFYTNTTDSIYTLILVLYRTELDINIINIITMFCINPIIKCSTFAIKLVEIRKEKFKFNLKEKIISINNNKTKLYKYKDELNDKFSKETNLLKSILEYQMKQNDELNFLMNQRKAIQQQIIIMTSSLTEKYDYIDQFLSVNYILKDLYKSLRENENKFNYRNFDSTIISVNEKIIRIRNDISIADEKINILTEQLDNYTNINYTF